MVRRTAIVAGLAAALAALAGVAVLTGAGGGSGPAAAPRPTADRFDSARAFALLRMQVALGPRPAGSPASRALAEHLRRALPGGRLVPVPGGLQNVVGALPGRGRPILVGAHYDTKDIPGFVGANDGASGVAVVVESARALGRGARACDRRVRFVLFDGEEAPGPSDDGDFLADGVRGSRADAALQARRTHAMVLLDMVGDRDLRIPREAGSDPALWTRLRAAAAAVGTARAFPPGSGPAISDDHVPYVARGVPAIDVIDFDYAPWHTTGDALGRVSPRSLDAVGETLVEMVRAMRREACPR